MDTIYYHEKNVDRFIYEKLCQRSPALWECFRNNDIHGFRSGLYTSPLVDFNLRHVVYSLCLNSMRGELYSLLSSITSKMKPFGDLIIVGDEALNHYLSRRQKPVSTSFRLKCVPNFFVPSIGSIYPDHPLYLGYLQASKVLLWFLLGKAAQKYSYSVTRVMKKAFGSNVARLIGLKLKNVNAVVVRKYNKIKSTGEEYMSLCLKVRYFHTKYRSIGDDLIHLMDVQLKKNPQTTYDYVNSRKRGVTFYDNSSGMLNYYHHILVASRRFLVEGDTINLTKSKLVLFARCCCRCHVVFKMSDEDIAAIIRDACPSVPCNYPNVAISPDVWAQVLGIDVTKLDKFTFKGTLTRWTLPPHVWVEGSILKNVEAIPNACN